MKARTLQYGQPFLVLYATHILVNIYTMPLAHLLYLTNHYALSSVYQTMARRE